MQDLYGLIRLYKFYTSESASLKKIAKRGTLECSFIEGLLKKDFTNDRKAISILFDADKDYTKYRMLKSRIRDKLFSAVCERYLELSSREEIGISKVYKFLKGMYNEGYYNLTFHFLKRVIKKNHINDLELKIKLYDLFTRLKQDMGKIEFEPNEIRNIIQLKEGLNLKDLILRKHKEYVSHRNDYDEKYRKTLLIALIDALKKKHRSTKCKFVPYAIKCLKGAYFFELGKFEKIISYFDENDFSTANQAHIEIPGSFAMLNLLLFTESLVRLKYHFKACKVLKSYPFNISNDTPLRFELIELQIISLITQREYNQAYHYIEALKKSGDFVGAQNKTNKILLISLSLKTILSKNVDGNSLPRSMFSGNQNKIKYCFDYTVLFTLLKSYFASNTKSLSISKKKTKKLKDMGRVLN